MVNGRALRKNIRALVIVALCNALLYLPVIASDNFMVIGVLDAIQAYFSIGSGIYMLWHIFRDDRSFKGKAIVISIGLFVILAPRIIHQTYLWSMDYSYHHQVITSDTIREKLYSDSVNLIPPMKHISVKVDGQNVYLEMEHDTQASDPQYPETEFKEELLSLLKNDLYVLSEFDQLKLASIRVQYVDKAFIFNDVPLKDSKGRPFHGSDEIESIVPILKEKMIVE